MTRLAGAEVCRKAEASSCRSRRTARPGPAKTGRNSRKMVGIPLAVTPDGGVMKRMLLRVAGLTVVVCALSVATAQAQSHFSVHVGVGVPVGPVVVAPRVAVGAAYPYPAYPAYYGPAPYPGYVWQPSYYVGYQWYPGA